MPNGNQNQAVVSPLSRDYHDVIAKVAAVKDLDVSKLEKLMQLQEDWERRAAATHFATQMALAQGEMTSISKDSANPSTRSRYASLVALDAIIRPIYTKYGFAVDFTEEQYTKEDVAHIVASVSCGSLTKHYHFFVPWTTHGSQGRAVHTPTHAKMGAITYARRGLLKMIFNLAEADDDGNLGHDNYPRQAEPERTPAPLDIAPIIEKMKACESVIALEDYLDRFKGQWASNTKEEVTRVRALRDELRAKFAEKEGSDGDRVAG